MLPILYCAHVFQPIAGLHQRRQYLAQAPVPIPRPELAHKFLYLDLDYVLAGRDDHAEVTGRHVHDGLAARDGVLRLL